MKVVGGLFSMLLPDEIEHSKMREEGKLLPDGVNVQYYPDHGPLQQWRNRQE